MNNCKVELKKAISQKSGKEYYYLSFSKNNKEIAKVFIKDTEILYYQDLLK